MKIFLFITALQTTQLTLGSVEYRQDSILPDSVQRLISTHFVNHCPEIASRNWQAIELNSVVRVDRVDNGLTDFYFTTHLEVHAIELDSNHTKRIPVMFKARRTQANNGTFDNLESVENSD